MRNAHCLAGLALAFLAAAPQPAAALDAVYLVRHAEKADGWPEGDRALDVFWPLSPAGIERARALAGRLAGVGVAAVYTSSTVRAFATGLPLAEAAAVPIVVDPGSAARAEMDAFLARLRERHAADRAVVVVGHSNTVPELLARLGATPDCHARLGIKTRPSGLEIEGYDGIWRVELGKPGCDGMKREEGGAQVSVPNGSRKTQGSRRISSRDWKNDSSSTPSGLNQLPSGSCSSRVLQRSHTSRRPSLVIAAPPSTGRSAAAGRRRPRCARSR